MNDKLRNRVALFILPAVAAWTLSCAPAASQSVEEFYRGKSIKEIIPTGPGGSYSLYASIINERLARQIPGNPGLAMQFMPSGIQALNYLYKIPARDGLTIGMISPTAGIVQVLTPEHVRYDLRKFAALGLFSQVNAVLTVSERSAARSVDDLKKTPLTLAATDTTSFQYVIPQMMNRYLGTKLRVMTGYKGIAETMQAMERGEVDGVFAPWPAIKEQRAKPGFDDKGRVLLQVGYSSEPDLDAPRLQTLARDERARQAFAFIASSSALSRGLIAPPDVPADRVAALREAVAATIADPELAAALQQKNLTFRPLSWQVQQQIMDQAAATPRALVEYQPASLAR